MEYPEIDLSNREYEIYEQESILSDYTKGIISLYGKGRERVMVVEVKGEGYRSGVYRVYAPREGIIFLGWIGEKNPNKIIEY